MHSRREIFQKGAQTDRQTCYVLYNIDVILQNGLIGGKNGGKIMYSGAPEIIQKAKNSATAEYIIKKLNE